MKTIVALLLLAAALAVPIPNDEIGAEETLTKDDTYWPADEEAPTQPVYNNDTTVEELQEVFDTYKKYYNYYVELSHKADKRADEAHSKRNNNVTDEYVAMGNAYSATVRNIAKWLKSIQKLIAQKKVTTPKTEVELVTAAVDEATTIFVTPAAQTTEAATDAPTTAEQESTTPKPAEKPTTVVPFEEPTTAEPTEERTAAPSTVEPTEKPATVEPTEERTTAEPVEKSTEGSSTAEPTTRQTSAEPVEEPITVEPIEKPTTAEHVEEPKVVEEPTTAQATAEPATEATTKIVEEEPKIQPEVEVAETTTTENPRGALEEAMKEVSAAFEDLTFEDVLNFIPEEYIVFFNKIRFVDYKYISLALQFLSTLPPVDNAEWREALENIFEQLEVSSRNFPLFHHKLVDFFNEQKTKWDQLSIPTQDLIKKIFHASKILEYTSKSSFSIPDIRVIYQSLEQAEVDLQKALLAFVDNSDALEEVAAQWPELGNFFNSRYFHARATFIRRLLSTPKIESPY